MVLSLGRSYLAFKILFTVSRMRFKVIISNGEGGRCECPSARLRLTGRTVEEALENIKDAIQGYLDVLGDRTLIKDSERIVEVRLNVGCPWSLEQKQLKRL